MAHPTLATRSVKMTGVKGRAYLYLSVMDAGGGGRTFMVSLSPSSGPASPEMLSAFRSVLTGLHFDPTRVCDWDWVPGHDVVERRVEPAPKPPAAPAPTPKRAEFDVYKAMSGCAMLQKLFVDVYCLPARAESRDVWVVSFQKGKEPAANYLDRYRERITAPWCWAARDHGDAPGLLFTTEIEGTADYREYSCERSGWGKSVPRDRVKIAE